MAKRQREPEPEPEPEQLVAVGASCVIHDDQNTAAKLENGSHLLAHTGDDSLLLDRFDCRMLLDKVEVDRACVRTDGTASEPIEVEAERWRALRDAEQALEREEAAAKLIARQQRDAELAHAKAEAEAAEQRRQAQQEAQRKAEEAREHEQLKQRKQEAREATRQAAPLVTKVADFVRSQAVPIRPNPTQSNTPSDRIQPHPTPSDVPDRSDPIQYPI